jgi:hypothetical protein
VLAAITAAVSGPVVVAVALAYQLEHLVAVTYPADSPAQPAEDLALELEFPSQPTAFLQDAPAGSDAPARPPGPPGPGPGSRARSPR